MSLVSSAPVSQVTLLPGQQSVSKLTRQGAELEPTPIVEGAEAPTAKEKSDVREAFDDFVGQTFYSMMLQQLRKTVGKSAYFDGGRAEEVFQGQLDQVIAEKLSDASAESFTGPMFELFQLPRS